jgi:arylsulfatase A-like enzyme
MPGWTAQKPHILYILADDLGWQDVGFHGGKIQTPNLDKLAAGGAVLNAFYVQPFSSQTRAALMTGRYPMRYGLQTLSILPSSQFGLPADERTIAQALKEVGYRTAFIGKWQLGRSKPELWPTKRGFDYFYGALSAQDDYMIRKASKSDWRRGEHPVDEEGYVTALLAKDAVDLINKHDLGIPLFLLVSFTAPAAPYGAPKEFVDRYAAIKDDARRNYAAAVTALDEAVGQLTAALERKAMLDGTLVIFHSDNGGAVPTKFPTGDGDVNQVAADNGIYREGKGSVYEGGVRVVALASWPGKIQEKTVVTGLLHVTDMYATLLKLAGASLEQPKTPDGLDVWPTLARGQLSPRKEILLNVEALRGAIRVGEWKLVVRASLPSKLELFDVANDPEEADNQAGAYPERTKEMLARLNAYAYDMAPAKYLEDLTKCGEVPMYWGDNPLRR